MLLQRAHKAPGNNRGGTLEQRQHHMALIDHVIMAVALQLQHAGAAQTSKHLQDYDHDNDVDRDWTQSRFTHDRCIQVHDEFYCSSRQD